MSCVYDAHLPRGCRDRVAGGPGRRLGRAGVTDVTDAPADFAQISAEFADLYASARRMVWVAPRQTLIDLRACVVVLAHHVLDGCSYYRIATPTSASSSNFLSCADCPSPGCYGSVYLRDLVPV